jgi:cation transport ATPase
MILAADGKSVGLIAAMDTLKESAAEAVEQLKRLKLEVAILTGDNERTARAIADQLGITQVLTRDDLRDVALGIELSKRTMRKIDTNLLGAFAYNSIMIPVAAAGPLNPLYATGAMAISSLTVVSN